MNEKLINILLGGTDGASDTDKKDEPKQDVPEGEISQEPIMPETMPGNGEEPELLILRSARGLRGRSTLRSARSRRTAIC